MKLKYFSHSAFLIETQKGVKILIDPFLDGNPTSPNGSGEIIADYIIVTHAHGDHLGDTFKIAKRCNSTIIATYELAKYCESKGYNVHDMHIGGSYEFQFGRVKFTLALHGSSAPDGTNLGLASGVILSINGINIYHTGDTGLFSDMKLIGESTKINYMLVPIGDNYTMDINDAVKAVDFVNPEYAIPIHYNTFPVIKADPEEFIEKINANEHKGIHLQFGQEIEI